MMSSIDDGGAKFPSVEYNDQLISPALSPISEHGVCDVQAQDNPHEGRIPTSASRDQLHPRRRSSETRTLKLSPKQIINLTTSPDSLPLEPVVDDESIQEIIPVLPTPTVLDQPTGSVHRSPSQASFITSVASEDHGSATPGHTSQRPHIYNRKSSARASKIKPQLQALRIDEPSIPSHPDQQAQQDWLPSPMPAILPLPPPSLPTYLHLELASERPSALYIHRSAAVEFPYESSKVKFERLLNFLLLPPNLEQVLWFGAVACLDAWLYTFTILPLRFLKALVILLRWWTANAIHEVFDLGTFVYRGLGRIRDRQRRPSTSRGRQATRPDGLSSRRPSELNANTATANGHAIPGKPPRKHSSVFRHRRTRSTPSILLPNHKADLLQGALIIVSCFVLMSFDASRMYHSIRGQAAIKLYVIYNVLEVFDRLFSALGQDVLECLFSKETLERDTDGRSKILRPLWMFALALVYNVAHATALFYQVVTLNVAVNSYSNALLTLLMSNQFVEIKGTVFKKFEKENLFQLTCADVVERFQLWLMLLIIALRNIVEVGGLNISLQSAFNPTNSATTTTPPINTTLLPFLNPSIIPKAFTILPTWTGEVLTPFLIVLGSEALVDWCKHAYITKFNNVRPNIYNRFLDLLAKDYYVHAFSASAATFTSPDGGGHDHNLTKRLGLPVLPLACLFIRACVQTYHMFLAVHVSAPPAMFSSPSITALTDPTPPAASSTPALRRLDHAFRRALGRSTFGAGGPGGVFADAEMGGGTGWTGDDVIALATMVIFFLAIYLVLLALKLVLGMTLLTFARNRYARMKEREVREAVVKSGVGVAGKEKERDREKDVVDAPGRRMGGWGMVEVSEEKRRWVYEDDPEGLEALKEKEARARQKMEKGEMKLDKVERYTMAAKRIW